MHSKVFLIRLDQIITDKTGAIFTINYTSNRLSEYKPILANYISEHKPQIPEMNFSDDKYIPEMNVCGDEQIPEMNFLRTSRYRRWTSLRTRRYRRRTSPRTRQSTYTIQKKKSPTAGASAERMTVPPVGSHVSRSQSGFPACTGMRSHAPDEDAGTSTADASAAKIRVPPVGNYEPRSQ